MTHVEHQPWCTHHHHVDLTDAADLSNGGAEDWCCYRGPRDSSGRRIEITDHNRFLGVKITDWVYPGEAMTAEDARDSSPASRPHWTTSTAWRWRTKQRISPPPP